MKPVIGQFIEQVSSIDEIDYGDFMRKANHYLMELGDQLAANANREVRKIYNDMKRHLQFNPNWDVESTRSFILKEARHIDALV